MKASVIALFLVSSACGGASRTSEVKGGARSDAVQGDSSPDASGVTTSSTDAGEPPSCGDLQNMYLNMSFDLRDAPAPCEVDGDCLLVQQSCALGCGVAVSDPNQASQLEAIGQRFVAHACPVPGNCDCVGPTKAVCKNQQCQVQPTSTN
jgi:hypothetical protein